MIVPPLLDLKDQKFNMLTVLERGENRGRWVMWLCKCDCGNLATIRGSHLTNNNTTSCGCVKTFDLVGNSYGRLKVLERLGPGTLREIHWLCQCECGNLSTPTTSSLTGGHTESCGCLGREKVVAANTGRSKYNGFNSDSRIYKIWHGIKQRCYNPNCGDSRNYGGRGIAMWPGWYTDIQAFADYVKEAPSPKHTIDRIDNDGDYAPGNIRWGTKKQQANNTRTNHRITYKGRTQTLTEWSEETGVSCAAITYRLYRRNPRMTIEKAFCTPMQERKRKSENTTKVSDGVANAA